MGLGGFGEGSRRVRRFAPCEGGGACDWSEDASQTLAEDRWYSAAVVLPADEDEYEEERVMVVGGRNAFSFEFFPKRDSDESSFTLPLLTSSTDTGDSYSVNDIYPFVHHSPDGMFHSLVTSLVVSRGRRF